LQFNGSETESPRLFNADLFTFMNTPHRTESLKDRLELPPSARMNSASEPFWPWVRQKMRSLLFPGAAVSYSVGENGFIQQYGAKGWASINGRHAHDDRPDAARRSHS
jgi:hypothetical protein